MSKKSRKRAKREAKAARVETPIAVVPPARVPEPIRVHADMLRAAPLRRRPEEGVTQNPWTIPQPPPGVVPEGATMASDQALSNLYGWAGEYGGIWGEGLAFPGYPYLAELAQRAEYRRPTEQIAKEMTRKWIKLTAGGSGEGDKTEKLAEIDTIMKDLRVPDTFRKSAEHEGFFGRGQIFIDVGSNTKRDELEKPLFLNPAKIRQGGMLRLTNVEPLWTYPAAYNARDPLEPDYYKPQAWYSMGRKVHVSRWLTFVGREVPDMLKPAYMFGGLSLSQMGKPYVDNWLRTRQSVSDLISAFSTMVVLTDMSAAFSGQLGSALGAIAGAVGGSSLANRVALFNEYRDNSGVMLIDKQREDFKNVSAPLGTLDKLQAQSQEHMAAVWGIPLVVLLGISPAGLNASTDGEIAVWQAWVEAWQEHLFRAPLMKLLKIIQLWRYGVIDPDIGFQFEPLGKASPVDLAAIRKSDIDGAVALIGAGVISPEEERRRLAADEDTVYPGLQAEDVPEVPEVEEPADPNADPADNLSDREPAAEEA